MAPKKLSGSVAVVMRTIYASPTGNAGPGDTIVVPAEEAKQLINSRCATLAPKPKPQPTPLAGNDAGGADDGSTGADKKK